MGTFYKNIGHIISIGVVLGLILVVSIIFMNCTTGKTQREIMFAEAYCSSKGYSSIHNLDFQKGLKRTYTVHCVKGNDIFEAKYE